MVLYELGMPSWSMAIAAEKNKKFKTFQKSIKIGPKSCRVFSLIGKYVACRIIILISNKFRLIQHITNQQGFRVTIVYLHVIVVRKMNNTLTDSYLTAASAATLLYSPL